MPARSSARPLASLLALAVAGACTGDDGGAGVTATADPDAVRLVSTGGDVFAWEQRVEGRGACSDVVALVDGTETDTAVQTDGDTFSFGVPIRPGEQAVAAGCTTGDGDVETDPITLTGMLEARPTARIDVSIEDETVSFDGAASEPTQPDGTPIASYSWEPYRQVGAPSHDLRLSDGAPFRHEEGRRLALQAPTEDGEYFVSLTVTDDEGRSDTSTTYFVVEDGRARAVDMMREHPSWIDNAIVYAPVHQLWGGGASAVEDRLPYLEDLGVDALWLWPPVTTRAFGEQYAITDYFTLDPEWGTEREFRSLVDRAHELGIRVLLDFVPNHSSIEHPYFQTAKNEGPRSHYWGFYDRDANGDYTHYFDWDHLPNLNYDNPQVRTMMTEAFEHWIRDFDVDGFRVDAAWGIKRRRPDYWAEWRAELKRVKPDLLLLAEATARDPYYFRNGFDVGYDWTSRPGQWPWASAWDFPQEAQALLAPTLTNQGQGYPKDAIVLRFLNNNDTGVRFLDQHGVDMTRVASALEFTVPGIPLLFAGDEIGASYQPYTAYDRLPWKDKYGLREWYDGLIGLRDTLPALRSHEISVLQTDDSGTLAYVRPAFAGGDPVLVVLNFDRAGSATIADDPALAAVTASGALEDALTGEQLSVPSSGDLTLRMPAHSVRVLVPPGGAS
jgi:cyclomaltodextrinase / maltogenic alpha-amylase / neopullulanase